MKKRFIFLLITFGTIAIPICWAFIDASDKDGETLADDSNQVLQNAFHQILDRRRRAASDLVVSVKFEAKENKSISEFSQNEKDFLLHVHNAYRSVVQPYAANMLEVVWDDDIAAFAQDWANQCQAQHRPIRDLLPWINMGENIYWIYSGKYHEGYATKFWWDEVQWYNYSTMECVPGQQCGHYITMVWAATDRIGCGVNRCPRLWALPDYGRGAYYFVCNYSGRFYSSRRPYREHDTICSRCFRTDAPKCRYNLCVTQEMLDNDIGYNGSTAEIGINRTRTSSSIKSPPTATPTTTSSSSSTSLDISNTSSSLASPSTTVTTPNDTSTFVSTVNTTTVTLSTISSINTTSNTTFTPMTTSVSEPGDTTETTIKYETDDKSFIVKAVDEIIDKFNSGNNLSMFSLKVFAGIALLVLYVIFDN